MWLSKVSPGTGELGSLAATIFSTVFRWPTNCAVSANAAPPMA